MLSDPSAAFLRASKTSAFSRDDSVILRFVEACLFAFAALLSFGGTSVEAEGGYVAAPILRLFTFPPPSERCSYSLSGFLAVLCSGVLSATEMAEAVGSSVADDFPLF
jgi:hypothetical protein